MEHEIVRSSHPEVQSNFLEITPRHGCSPLNLLHICRTPFTKNTSVNVRTRICMQNKLELFSTEIASGLENKELLSHFRVYRKISTSAQTDERITTDEPLYTGT